MTRRRLLRLSVFSALVLSGGALVGGWVAGGYSAGISSDVAGRLRTLSVKEYVVLAAVARRILDGVEPPVGGGAEPAVGAGGPDVALWADGYLAGMAPGLVADVRGLLHLVEHAPLAAGRAGRFTRLDAEAQDAVLRDWADSRLALRRQGFQALKSLCCLAYYQDARSFAAIGYSGPML